jgi:D-sedoheptulose 7-phosphate isomerase
MRREIAEMLEESARIKRDIAAAGAGEIERSVNLIIKSYRAGGKVILLGNGGSAADAQHLAAELMGRFKLTRAALPAIALTTNTSILTALTNDYGYETVFSRQIEALASDRDVVIGISTSGESTNVIEALKAARQKGAGTIALTGRSGGGLARVADVALAVPSDDTPRIQEAHITIGHIICELVERELAANR